MKIENIGENILKKAKILGAEEIEVYIERVKRFEVNVRKGENEIFLQ